MRSKFMKGVFGSCPRVHCDRQLTIPVGMSEELSTSRVKVSIFKNRFIAQNVKRLMSREIK